MEEKIELKEGDLAKFDYYNSTFVIDKWAINNFKSIKNLMGYVFKKYPKVYESIIKENTHVNVVTTEHCFYIEYKDVTEVKD